MKGALGEGSSSHIRSDVRKHFEKRGPKSALCRLCNKEYAYLKGTSKLREQLRQLISETATT